MTTAPQADRATETVLQAAAVLSGYPRRLLTPVLSLTRDLGLGGEGLDALLEHLGGSRQADDFQTLADVIAWYRNEGAPAVADAVMAPMRPTPVQRPAPPPEPAVRAETTAVPGEIQSHIITLLSEKTGYPPEILGEDLDLEGELGIDTVKQAEILGLLFQHYSLELPESTVLREASTIAKVAELMTRLRGDVAEPLSTASQGDIAAPERQIGPGLVPGRFWRAKPVPLERKVVPFSLQEGLVVLTDDGQGLAEATATRLRESGFTPRIVALGEPLSMDRVAGFIHLAPAGIPPAFPADLEQVQNHTALAARQAFLALKALQPEGFAVSVSRVDGVHGLMSRERNPIPFGAHGVLKSWSHEKPECRVRCYDLQPSLMPDIAAQRLVDDLLSYDGPVEVGMAGREPCQLVYDAVDYAPSDAQLSADDVFLVSGGARGLTAACIIAVAQALGGGRFALLGRTALHPEGAKLAQCSEGELETRKQALTDEMQRSGERLTPVALERAWQPLMQSREICRTLTTLEALGATAHYLVCDVADPKAVGRAVQTCREELGAPTVVLHGAGIDRSRQLLDKSEEEFDLVYGVKVAGWWNLQTATRHDPVRLFTVFSSVVGRFGNAGQADYAAANGVLSAMAQQLKDTQHCRHLALAWTAWAETGMAARSDTLDRLTQAGIEPLATETGTASCVRAMTGAEQGELLVCGSLGALDRWQSLRTSDVARHRYFVDDIAELLPAQRLLARRRLSRSRDRFLEDHTVEQYPYLPAVMGLEGFAEAAQLLHPELSCRGFEDVTFQLPIKLTGATLDVELVAETIASPERVQVACRSAIPAHDL